jgi:integrase
MPRLKLSARFIETVKPDPRQRLEFLDVIVPQLMLRVGETGHKSFALLARYPGAKNPTRRLLGPVYEGPPLPPAPDILTRPGAALTLAEARDKARLWLGLISRQTDPGALVKAKQAAAEQATAAALFETKHTFGALAKDWLGKHGSKLKKWRQAERIIAGEFVARWKDRPLSSLSWDADVKPAIDAITARSRTGAQAHAAFGYLRQVFNYALDVGGYGLDKSPMERRKPAKVIGERQVRIRTLNDAELRAVWQAGERMGYPWGDCVRLLILTGQRLREIADLAWHEVDLDQKLITIGAARMKNGAAHEVPLAPMALSLIQGLPPFAGARFLFSTTHGRTHIGGFYRAKLRLDELSGVGGWVLHDARRTMRTRLSGLAIEDRVREAVIAHAPPGLHRIYDQHSYQAEKRRALTLWEERLAAIIETEKKVAALGRQ